MEGFWENGRYVLRSTIEERAAKKDQRITELQAALSEQEATAVEMFNEHQCLQHQLAAAQAEIEYLRQANEALKREVIGLKGRFYKDQERIKAQADYAATLSANNAMLRELLEEAMSYTSCPSWSPSMTYEIQEALNATKEQPQ